MLRSNKDLEGINVNGIKALLSQFADDLDLFTKFKQESWEAAMKTFTKFEVMSGMKINYNKTKVYRLGSI